MQNDVNNVYLQKSAACVKIDAEKLPIVQLSNLVSFLTPLLEYVFVAQLIIIQTLNKLVPTLAGYVEELPPFWIMNRVQEVIDIRTASSSSSVKYVDLLQLMLDASTCGAVKVSRCVLTTMRRIRHLAIDCCVG
jgi:hypothetical protein